MSAKTSLMATPYNEATGHTVLFEIILLLLYMDH